MGTRSIARKVPVYADSSRNSEGDCSSTEDLKFA
jgi:hypothetical protein